jgi:hypothetical protein
MIRRTTVTRYGERVTFPGNLRSMARQSRGGGNDHAAQACCGSGRLRSRFPAATTMPAAIASSPTADVQ